MDRDLGESVTGEELASFIEETVRKNIPVLLVSQSKPKCEVAGRGNIHAFVHKSEGSLNVIRQAAAIAGLY